MYEAYWGLREAPFEISPSPRFLYLAPEHEEALVRLLYVVQHRKGYGMLTGEHGCGKTALARALVHRLEVERYEIAYVTNPGGGVVEVLREILHQLGAAGSEIDRLALLHRLEDACYRSFRAGRDTVLVVDEAQRIASDEVFEELRLLTNLQSDERPLLTLLLVGGPDLAARIASVRPLAQRIAIRCRVGPLDAEHVGRYVRHRLRVAGGEPGLFTDAALRRVHAATGGTPREINAVCDLALLLGHERRRRLVDEDLVADAVGDGSPAAR